jgi:tetratricopeptide (TPR) repeat protein
MAEQDPDGLGGEWSLPPESQEELLALARMLRRARGAFALAFARCNVVPMRERLVAMLQDALTPAGVTIHETALDANAPDIPAALSGAPGDGDPLFVYDLEQTMPSRSPAWAQAQLNERRPLYQKLGRPLVFWLPEYALQLIARGAPDFWAWRSGVYEFALPEAGREALLEREVRQVGWTAQWNLDRVAAEARLHLLRGMLDEYAAGPGAAEAGRQGEEMRRARAETLRKLADLEAKLVGYAAAEGRLQEALRIYERLDDRRGVAVTQHDLADLYRLRGEYAEAERLYRAALHTAEELGDRQGLAITLHNLALLRRDQGRTEEALDLLARSRDLFAALGLEKDVAEEEELIAEIERGSQDSNG